MARVAITGIGTINPLGKDKNEFKTNLKKMHIGVDKITQFDTTDHKVEIAAEIKDFSPENYMDKKSAKRYDRYIQLAMVASSEAISDAAFKDDNWRENTAVIISSGIGGFKTLYNEFNNMNKNGPKSVSPFLIPMMIADMASGIVSIEHKLKGPNFSTMSACASSIHAIITTSMLIKHGYIDVGITGGAEACIDPMPIAAFANMTALSRRNDDPATASRPFDKDRDGFVMGEAAGILVLENEDHARKRGAKIYGYIDGWGMSGDAYHLSKSDPEGAGAEKAMKQALEMSGLSPDNIDLISCHATSTPAGDNSEISALKNIFGENISTPFIQATKTLLGHSLGASGATEFIGGIIQAENGFVHGMPNLFNPDTEFTGLNIPKETKHTEIKSILKNSFGFGGHNASIVFTKEN
ncbi:MAG: beta-ketoacyl-ACP synthase II [Thermotogae bacterium]|nr:beta-ketoacyl-ACP synthase II [Thermotogota bacterium]HOO73769.1 beta-ketoacyl-ACP synthase II [Tepiditoga sp.]